MCKRGGRERRTLRPACSRTHLSLRRRARRRRLAHRAVHRGAGKRRDYRLLRAAARGLPVLLLAHGALQPGGGKPTTQRVAMRSWHPAAASCPLCKRAPPPFWLCTLQRPLTATVSAVCCWMTSDQSSPSTAAIILRRRCRASSGSPATSSCRFSPMACGGGEGRGARGGTQEEKARSEGLSRGIPPAAKGTARSRAGRRAAAPPHAAHPATPARWHRPTLRSLSLRSSYSASSSADMSDTSTLAPAPPRPSHRSASAPLPGGTREDRKQQGAQG